MIAQESEITQDSVREKLLSRCRGLKVKYIAEQTGIPREIISAFKNNRRELWQESLECLNECLEKFPI